MTTRVRPHFEAELELIHAIEWYEHKRQGLGAELWDEVQRSITLITANPAVGGLIRRANVSLPVRRIPLRRFPYFLNLP